MTHGEQMALYGKFIALQEVMIYTQNKLNKLNKKLQEAKNGSSKTSTNRSR